MNDHSVKQTIHGRLLRGGVDVSLPGGFKPGAIH